MPEAKPSIPDAVGQVPWDPAELAGRTCNACACYFESPNPENPLQYQGFCRRAPAEVTKVRGMEVRRDLKGNPVMKDGKEVMQPCELIGYLFKPAQRLGTCYDGWRAKGMLPGDTPQERLVRKLKPLAAALLPSLTPEIRSVVKLLWDIEDPPASDPTEARN